MDEKSDRPQVSRTVQLIRLQTLQLFTSHVEHNNNPAEETLTDEETAQCSGLEKDKDPESCEPSRRRARISALTRAVDRVANHCATYPPLSLFAHWILETKLFKTVINVVVILSVIVLAIEAEYHDNLDPSVETLHVVLRSLNWCILEVFFLEILLKWLDNFSLFWKSPWNIFDFIVTVVPVLPEFLPEASEDAGTSHHLLKLLIQFRVLRCLKIISSFREMRVVLLTIFKIFQAPQYKYLFLVLLIEFYIFAVFGVCLFKEYTTSTVQGLLYQDDFKDVPNALVTLFSIFTMDHCSTLLKDIRRVPQLNYPACVVFIVVWFFFGSITMSNISVGLMVDSFKSIRKKLHKEMKRRNAERNAESFKARVCHSDAEHVREGEGPSTGRDPGNCRSVHLQEDIEWEKSFGAFIHVHEEKNECERVQWHEDTLLKYFRLLEKLQHNQEESQRLQDVAAQALLNLHDN